MIALQLIGQQSAEPYSSLPLLGYDVNAEIRSILLLLPKMEITKCNV